MYSSVSAKDEIWFLRLCHHISNALYQSWKQDLTVETAANTLARSKASAVDNDVCHGSEGVRETGCDAVDLIHPAHDTCQWLADVNRVTEFTVL
jgi:hypothetical protein